MALIDTVLDQLVSRMDIRTTLGPTITIDEPFKVGPPSPASTAAGRVLKPSISILPRGQAKPIVFAPYGDPGITKWPVIVFGGGALLGWLTWRAFGR